MKKALAFLMLLVLTFSVVVSAPEAESFAKAKKKKPKAETTVSEEASRFTIKTWKPTYSNWSKSEIEKASTRGTGKNLFDKYGALYDLKLAKNKKFVNFLYSIDSVTDGGWYGVLEDNQNVICKYLQKNIKTVADQWLYFTLTRYSYNEDELGNAEAVLLAVKPQFLADALNGLKSILESKLIISIAAGISLEKLYDMTDSSRIVRVMSNFTN